MVNSDVWAVGVAINTISFIILLSLFIYHTIKVYEDFFTDNRKSVLHLNYQPKNDNFIYQLLGLFTWLTIFSITLYSGVVVFSYLPIYDVDTHCEIVVSFSAIGVISQFFLYVVYALRLEMIYGNSEFETPRRYLIGSLVLLFFWEIFLCILGVVYTLTEDFDIVVDESGWVITCQPDAPWWYLLLFFIANIAYSIFIVKPVIKLYNSLKASGKNNSKIAKELISFAMKVSILNGVLIISTFIIITLVLAIDLDLSALDGLINSMCLVFMTPYYPDKIYFYKFCKLCIKCCDKQKLIKHELQKNLYIIHQNSAQVVGQAQAPVNQAGAGASGVGASGVGASSASNMTGTTKDEKKLADALKYES